MTDETIVTQAVPAPGFQSEVADWMLECFGEEIAADRIERADRFLEEALELSQTIPGFTVDRARALVEYVFDRPVGERGQEVGGVGVTLAALCNTYDLNIEQEWRRELARVWTKVEAIRAKQASKPTGSALPIALSPPTSIEPVQKVHELTSGEALNQLQAMGQEFDAKQNETLHRAHIVSLDSLTTPTSGEEMRLRDGLEDHFPTGLRSGYARTAGGVPVQGGGIEIDCRCGWSTSATDEHQARQQWADHVRAALNEGAA